LSMPKNCSLSVLDSEEETTLQGVSTQDNKKYLSLPIAHCLTNNRVVSMALHSAVLLMLTVSQVALASGTREYMQPPGMLEPLAMASPSQ
jgi:hypothetical protein